MRTVLPRLLLVLTYGALLVTPVSASPASDPPRSTDLQRWSPGDREMALKAAVVDAFDGVDKAMAAHDYSAALELLLRLHAALPRSSTIANNIGYVQGLLGHVDEALAAYRRANDLDPANSIAAVNVGHVLLDRGRLDEAARRLVPWKSKAAEFPAVCFVLVRLADLQRKPGEARSLLLAIAASPKSSANQVFDAGGMLRAMGDSEGAAQAFRTVIKREPTIGGAWMNLSDILRVAKRLDESEQVAEEAVRRFPTVGAAYLQRGMIRKERGRWVDAAADLERAAELKRDLADGLVMAAACMVKAGRLKDAQSDLDKFKSTGEPMNGYHRELAKEVLEATRRAEASVGRSADASARPAPSPGPTTGAASRDGDALPALDTLIWSRVARRSSETFKSACIEMWGHVGPGAATAYHVRVFLTDRPAGPQQRPTYCTIPDAAGSSTSWRTDVTAALTAKFPGVAWIVGKDAPGSNDFRAVGQPGSNTWVWMTGTPDAKVTAMVARAARGIIDAMGPGELGPALRRCLEMAEEASFGDATIQFQTVVGGCGGEPMEFYVRVRPWRLIASPGPPKSAVQRWHRHAPWGQEVVGSFGHRRQQDPEAASPGTLQEPITNGMSQRRGRYVVDVETVYEANLTGLPAAFDELVGSLFPGGASR